MATSIERRCPKCRRTTEFLAMSGVDEYCRGCGERAAELFKSKPRTLVRFNLRLTFVLVTALTLLLGVFHRPLGELLPQLELNSNHWKAFRDPWRSTLWLVRVDIENFEGSEVSWTKSDGTEEYEFSSGETFFQFIGFCCCLIIWILVFAVAVYILTEAIEWATTIPSKEGG